jgi:hypothetical protein
LVADYEQSGDTIIRLLALEQRHEALQEHLTLARKWHRDWIARAFADDLEVLDPRTRQSALDALVIATDVYTWKLLRRDMKRGIAATQTAITGMIRRTLAGEAPVDDARRTAIEYEE